MVVKLMHYLVPLTGLMQNKVPRGKADMSLMDLKLEKYLLKVP